MPSSRTFRSTFSRKFISFILRACARAPLTHVVIMLSISLSLSLSFPPFPTPQHSYRRRETDELNAISRNAPLSASYLSVLDGYAAEDTKPSTKGDPSVPILNLDENGNRDTITKARELWRQRRTSYMGGGKMRNGRKYCFTQFCTCDELRFLDENMKPRLYSSPDVVHECTCVSLPQFGRYGGGDDDDGEEEEEEEDLPPPVARV